MHFCKMGNKSKNRFKMISSATDLLSFSSPCNGQLEMINKNLER